MQVSNFDEATEVKITVKITSKALFSWLIQHIKSGFLRKFAI